MQGGICWELECSPDLHRADLCPECWCSRAWKVANGRKIGGNYRPYEALGGIGQAGQRVHDLNTLSRKGGLSPTTVMCLQAKEVPGVKIFRSSVTMYFANAELYCDALKKKVRQGCPRSVPQSVTGFLTSCGQLPSLILSQCGVDVDHLIYRKKKLLKKEKRKLKQLQKKQKQAGPCPTICPPSLALGIPFSLSVFLPAPSPWGP